MPEERPIPLHETERLSNLFLKVEADGKIVTATVLARRLHRLYAIDYERSFSALKTTEAEIEGLEAELEAFPEDEPELKKEFSSLVSEVRAICEEQRDLANRYRDLFMKATEFYKEYLV